MAVRSPAHTRVRGFNFNYFSVNPFGLSGTLRDETAFVIFGKLISRIDNGPITARSCVNSCRSTAPFRYWPLPPRPPANGELNHANIVIWDTYLRWRRPTVAAGTQSKPTADKSAHDGATHAELASDTPKAKQPIADCVEICSTTASFDTQPSTLRGKAHSTPPDRRETRAGN